MFLLEVKIPTNMSEEFIWWPIKSGIKEVIEDLQNELKQNNSCKEFRIKKIV